MFAVPLALAAVGWRDASRFERAGVVYGVLLLVPTFVTQNLAEVRALVPFLFMMLPGALRGVPVVLRQQATTAGTHPLAH